MSISSYRILTPPLSRSLHSFRLCNPRKSSQPLGRVLHRPTLAPGFRAFHPPPRPQHHVASGFGSSLTYIFLAAGISIAAFYAWPTASFTPQHDLSDAQLQAENDAMAQGQALEGHIGNLTEEQAAKLRELWYTLFSIAGLMPGETPMSAPGTSPIHSRTTSISDAASTTPKKGKKRFSMFRRGADEGDDASEDKHGQMKEYRQALQDQTPQQLRDTIWTFVKLDNPDALMLRFLRARKWDVQKALIMMISTVHWRGQVVHLDDDLTIKGEEWFARQDKNGTGADKKLGQDFMAQIRMGKSFIHGCDNDGRPLCFVRVKLHRGGEQSEESLEKYTIYTIETTRMLLRNRVETATIVFDMTDFSMANMVCISHIRADPSSNTNTTGAGLYPSKIHDKVFRSKLSRMPGRCLRFQVTMDLRPGLECHQRLARPRRRLKGALHKGCQRAFQVYPHGPHTKVHGRQRGLGVLLH